MVFKPLFRPLDSSQRHQPAAAAAKGPQQRLRHGCHAVVYPAILSTTFYNYCNLSLVTSAFLSSRRTFYFPLPCLTLLSRLHQIGKVNQAAQCSAYCTLGIQLEICIPHCKHAPCCSVQGFFFYQLQSSELTTLRTRSQGMNYTYQRGVEYFCFMDTSMLCG